MPEQGITKGAKPLQPRSALENLRECSSSQRPSNPSEPATSNLCSVRRPNCGLRPEGTRSGNARVAPGRRAGSGAQAAHMRHASGAPSLHRRQIAT